MKYQFIFTKSLGIGVQNLLAMMESKVMFAVSELKIMTAKHVLASAGIEAFSIDKRDSAHAGVFGDIELFVDEAKAKEARQLLWDEGLI